MKINNTTKLIKTILITLIICLLAIILKGEFSPTLLKHAPYGMPALIERGSIDNLFIGSSMFRQGLDPLVLSEKFGSDGYYILSYNGNSPAMEAFELEHLIENGVKIKNLYVDMYIFSLFGEHEIQDEKIFIELNLRDKCRLYNSVYASPNISTFWRTYATANNELMLTSPIINPIIKTQFINGGSLSKTIGSTDESLSSNTILIPSKELLYSQKHGISKIVDLCSDNNINLTFIETPKYYIQATNHSYVDSMSKYKSLLSEIGTHYITYEDYSFDNTNSQYYVDSIHLSSEGRYIFTNSLLHILNK